MGHRFGFRFITPRINDTSFKPNWHVYVKGAAIDEAERTLVTPKDSMESQIDYQIDKLISELQEIRNKLKKKYETWNRSKTRS